MHYYNDYRPHESLKNKTPNQFEIDYYNKKATINSWLFLDSPNENLTIFLDRSTFATLIFADNRCDLRLYNYFRFFIIANRFIICESYRMYIHNNPLMFFFYLLLFKHVVLT